jgi:diacylglycerol kinase family enzyme
MLGFGLAMRRGELAGHRGYRVLEGRRVEIVAPRGDPLQVDGDPRGSLPVMIDRVPEALELIAPPARR